MSHFARMKFWKDTVYKEERFILAPSFRGLIYMTLGSVVSGSGEVEHCGGEHEV